MLRFFCPFGREGISAFVSIFFQENRGGHRRRILIKTKMACSSAPGKNTIPKEESRPLSSQGYSFGSRFIIISLSKSIWRLLTAARNNFPFPHADFPAEGDTSARRRGKNTGEPFAKIQKQRTEGFCKITFRTASTFFALSSAIRGFPVVQKAVLPPGNVSALPQIDYP